MTTDWAQIQTMLYLRLLLISFNLVLVLADHKEDEPQETNYYGSPTRGGLPIVAQPIQGTGTSDGHSTSRAERQSNLARISQQTQPIRAFDGPADTPRLLQALEEVRPTDTNSGAQTQHPVKNSRSKHKWPFDSLAAAKAAKTEPCYIIVKSQKMG